ncbi:hypothetical protein HZS_2824 [Henneguya salminicola]|nr:hypothetical protein HZS_2824 [Henneguya salminicola]
MLETTPIQDVPINKPDELKIYFVDLGLQIGYQSTYVLEYLAALVPYLLFYINFEKKRTTGIGYSAANERFAVFCWASHFVKRIYESLFVHKFSRNSMPLSNLFRNLIYYGYCLKLIQWV